MEDNNVRPLISNNCMTITGVTNIDRHTIHGCICNRNQPLSILVETNNRHADPCNFCTMANADVYLNILKDGNENTPTRDPHTNYISVTDLLAINNQVKNGGKLATLLQRSITQLSLMRLHQSCQ